MAVLVNVLCFYSVSYTLGNMTWSIYKKIIRSWWTHVNSQQMMKQSYFLALEMTPVTMTIKFITKPPTSWEYISAGSGG